MALPLCLSHPPAAGSWTFFTLIFKLVRPTTPPPLPTHPTSATDSQPIRMGTLTNPCPIASHCLYPRASLCLSAALLTTAISHRQCFPSVRSGRRRVVSPLRRIVAQIMPKSKGDHLKHFAAVLGPAAAYRVELKEEVEETGRVGSEAGKPPIEDEDQGRQGSARSLRHRGNGSLGSQLFTFGSSVREGSTAEEQQVALLEMPGVEDRLLLIEQAVKTLMEAEAARREVGSAVESR